MLKNFPKGTVFSFVPTLLFFPFIIYLILTGKIELFYFFYFLIGWILICGLGIGAGYHRVFAHKTHDLPLWKENIILLFASLGGQGSSILWTAIHRGYHHAYTDTVKDLHSPVNGFFQSFIGYTLQMTEKSNIPNYNYAKDLVNKPNHVWFHKNILYLQWGIPATVALFNWKLSLMSIILPMCISCIGDNLINFLAHTKLPFSYKVGNNNDNSYNNILLSFLCWGQAWHNGHHWKPYMFSHGRKCSGNWWEFDLCEIFLPFLGKPKND
jgi:stearoyl-CoA desaturase (delta-9 desaturase)